MINGLGQMALVVALFGLVLRKIGQPGLRALAHGFIFGGGAIVSMMSPALIAPGVLIDTRSIMVGLAPAFGGIPAGLVATAIAIVCRLSIGGPGTAMGVAGILIAFTAGIVWLRFWPAGQRERLSSLALLGLGIALHAGVVFASPQQTSALTVFEYLAAITTTSLVATMTLGWMMQREIALVARERDLAYDALTDPLTGLGNRRAFDHRLAEPGFRLGGPEFAVVMIDIDHFKSINDLHGHGFGDKVLKALAYRLSMAVRPDDLAVRYGGEEFAVLMPETGPAAATRIAEQLRLAVAAMGADELGMPFAVPASFAVTASLGVTTSRRHVDHRDVIMAADRALYRAKELGRNRVESETARGRGEGQAPSHPLRRVA